MKGRPKKYLTEDERLKADRASKKRWQDSHKEKRLETQRKRRAERYTPKRNLSPYPINTYEYKRDRHLKLTYGITLDDYNKMFQKQEGCCASCGVHQSELKQPLFVDHDHKTGEVRALLCRHCNTALGYVKDDVNILKSLVNYLTGR